MRRRWLLLNLLAPIAAIAFSVVLSSLMLWAAGYSPFEAWNAMIEYGTRSSSIVSIINRAVPLYIAGLAVALGFKMNLFNIGVEGQYRMAALVAAAFGAWVALPAPLHIAAIIFVAAIVGAAWASIPAVLKATRGVHEVISSIMLNTIATGMGAYLLSTWFKENRPGDLVPRTKTLPGSGQMPSLNGLLEKVGVTLPAGSQLRGFVLIAALLGVVYYFVVWRTRFGYDLRASGVNPSAAEASGVRMKAMSVKVLLISGAIAGLIGIGDVLGFYHSYSIDFPSGLGFTGIGVALLGRNHPVGIAAGSLLFAFLDRSAQILDARSIPREISTIMQGIILLCVVIAYEVVRRIGQAQETKAAAEATRHLEEEQDAREPAGASAS
jgi:simple sugar transport system permease protein